MGSRLGQGLNAIAHAQAALNVGRSFLRGLLAHHRAARPDVGEVGSGLDQHDFDAERVDFEAQRFAPAFEGMFGCGIAADRDRAEQSTDG